MSGLCQHLALIGYRASGKTSIGIRLAERLRCQWVDLDAFLEESSNRPIAEIFKQDGEARFRELESACLIELCERVDPFILSTGGGVVLSQENRLALSKHCHPVIYLKASAEVLSQRLSADGGGRPSLTGANIEDEVASVLGQRQGYYEDAATHVVDANSDFDLIVQHIVNIVEN